ncbi:MAG: aminopeptidase P family protein [Oscillospiraceae bacterium]|nr:aminopeptidase P family protein [Oscillospiraceae bacterium]
MNKIKDIQNALKNSELDAMLITGESNRRYATGFRSTAGKVLITGEDAYFFIDSRYIEAAEEHVRDCTVLMVDSRNDYIKQINEKLRDHNIADLGFEDGIMTLRDYNRFSEKLETKLVPGTDFMTGLRSSKSPEELEIMIKAQRIAEDSFNHVLGLITTDVTETEIAAELTYQMKLRGAEDCSFDPIIVSGEHSSIPHGEAENIKLKKGFLIMDFGAKYKGYCSDTTRTLCIGEPTDEMRKVYDIVYEAQATGIAAARAGVPGKEIDKAARDVIDNAGYKGTFGHSFGHSLGIDIHEEPNASPDEERLMPEGAVISAEPGIYLKGKFGVRIEDVLYLTENGNRNITNLRKDLIIL